LESKPLYLEVLIFKRNNQNLMDSNK